MQAQELDDLVQHLAVAKYALEAGEGEIASDAVDQALALARKVLTRKHAELPTAAGEAMVRTRSAGD